MKPFSLAGPKCANQHCIEMVYPPLCDSSLLQQQQHLERYAERYVSLNNIPELASARHGSLACIQSFRLALRFVDFVKQRLDVHFKFQTAIWKYHFERVRAIIRHMDC